MSVEDILRYPASRKVGLVDLSAPRALRYWTFLSGSTYYADVSGINVAGVLQDGEDQTARANAGEVESLGGYFWDVAASRVYVKSPYDSEVVQVVIGFYFASHAKDFASEDHRRPSRLSGVPKIRLSIGASYGGRKKTGGGSVDLVNADSFFDNFEGLNLDAGGVKFYVAADLLR